MILSRGGIKIRTRGYPWIKCGHGTGIRGENKRVFNYPLLYGYRYGFNDTHVRRYLYPLIN